MKTTGTVGTSADIKKTSAIFQLTKNPSNRYPFYPPVEIIPGICEVLYTPSLGEKNSDGRMVTEDNPADSYVRLARYQPGMRGIWADEWTDKEREKKVAKIHFRVGYLTVNMRDKNLLNYLRVAGYNKKNNETRMPDNGIAYKELDYEGDAKKIILNDRKSDEAKYFVNNAPLEDVRAIAQALAKSKAEVQNIYTMDEFTLRYSLRATAQMNPDLFVGKLKDGPTKNKVFIVKALQKGIIKINEDDSEISWASSGDVIVNAPYGMDVITQFSELAISNAEYVKYLDTIIEMVEDSSEEKQTITKDIPWNEKMVNDAIERKVISELGGHWFVIAGEEDEDPIFKVQGKKNLYASVLENKEGVIALIAERLN